MPIDYREELVQLGDELREGPDPFRQICSVMRKLARELEEQTGAPFVCKVIHEFIVELWLDSKKAYIEMGDPLVWVRMIDETHIEVRDTPKFLDSVEVPLDDLLVAVINRLRRPYSVQIIKAFIP